MLTGLLVTYLVLAPGVGLEPTTYALTAHRSTIELPGIIRLTHHTSFTSGQATCLAWYSWASC